MHRPRVILLVTAALIAALPAAAETGPGGVQFIQHGHGWQLVDAKGMSLYTFVRDVEPGKSNCKDACAEQWPPLAANADDTATGEWAPFQREDGTRQWSFRGQPLYAYARDGAAGDSYGDGVNEQWFIALKPIDTPAGVSVSKTLLGHVLADRKGMTLYTAEAAKSCDADCAKSWVPYAAPWVAKGEGDWTVVTRADGTKQWAFRGQALYRYAGDVKPRETEGHSRPGPSQGKAWAAIVLEPPPPRPAWVTTIGGDAGPILGDAKGHTIYARVPPRRRAPRYPAQVVAPTAGERQVAAAQVAGQVVGDAPDSDAEQMCGIECPGSDWRPVLAADGDKAVGNWSLVKRTDGALHWAFKGDVLYTNARDTTPGDLNGIRSGAGRNMRTLTPTGEQMPGTGA